MSAIKSCTATESQDKRPRELSQMEQKVQKKKDKGIYKLQTFDQKDVFKSQKMTRK